MKACEMYLHSAVHGKILLDGRLKEELIQILNVKEAKFGDTRPVVIKQLVSERFGRNGWADKVKATQHLNLTISYLKRNVGVCFQIGNVARTYADLLKLQLLYNRGVIDRSVLIVPHKLESFRMGANYAQFERVKNELEEFEKIITVPMLLIGLSN